MMVIGNSLLLASYSKIAFSQGKPRCFWILIWYLESALNSASNDVWIKKKLEKKIFDGPGVPYRCETTGEKWKSVFEKKSTSFYSEFNADSEYVILFKKYFGRKNGLIVTCPLNERR